MNANIEVDEGLHLVTMDDTKLCDAGAIHLRQGGEIITVLARGGVHAASLVSGGEETICTAKVLNVCGRWATSGIDYRVVAILLQKLIQHRSDGCWLVSLDILLEYIKAKESRLHGRLVDACHIAAHVPHLVFQDGHLGIKVPGHTLHVL